MVGPAGRRRFSKQSFGFTHADVIAVNFKPLDFSLPSEFLVSTAGTTQKWARTLRLQNAGSWCERDSGFKLQQLRARIGASILPKYQLWFITEPVASASFRRRLPFTASSRGCG